MTASVPPPPPRPAVDPAGRGTGRASPGDPPSSLRGASVRAVDVRRATRIVVALTLVALVVLVVVLFVAAADQNSRISRLQAHGVPVTVTVTACPGNLSGSGSSVAGFTCRGNFVLDGRRYNEVIGGNSDFHPSGQVLPAVVDPNDPSNLSTVRTVETTRTSWHPYIAPVILLIVLMLFLALLAGQVRRARSGAGHSTGSGAAGGGSRPEALPG